ncbi:MAG: NADH-quinone oxidoreductase subunit L, partial [Planctomycetota bacterium]
MHVAALIPWVPLVAAALCAACCASRRAREFAAPICISGIGSAFVMTLIAIAKLGGVEGDHYTAYFAPWIQAGGQWVDGQYVGGLIADFAYHVDSLTAIMMLAITGVGSMVSIYAAGYMKGDPGYARFFAGVSLFIFAMLHLVMADNFVVLFLGWEGVGLASYLLIGHYYFKPSAAAAAMKAFIVNRVGDFGFLLGVFCIYQAFGSIRFEEVLPAAKALVTGDASGLAPGAATAYASALASQAANPVYILAAPFGLMLGAFGKSAQLPLFVWLPDAMEGPSPVSALIHAATMVTAGVYLIARTIHLFELSPYALPTVAVVGSLTALIGAVIAASAFDLKKVFAYSTVSQLGYMFLGVSALSTYGAIFHLVTHAFFKAVLFLTAGSVMHALAGQLDMRKMS